MSQQGETVTITDENDNEQKHDNGKMPYIVFLLAKPQIDANNKRFVVSKKWWAPKWNQNARKNWNQLLVWKKGLKQPTVELTKQ